MVVRKEIIRPGVYWYLDPQTGLPCRLLATPRLLQYWHDTGNEMLKAGLSIPVPVEHNLQGRRLGAAVGARQGGEAAAEQRGVGAVVRACRAARCSRCWTSRTSRSRGTADDDPLDESLLHVVHGRERSEVGGGDRARRPHLQAADREAAAVPERGGGDVPTRGGQPRRAPRRRPCRSAPGLSPRSAGLPAEQDGKVKPAYPVAFSLWAGGIALAAATCRRRRRSRRPTHRHPQRAATRRAPATRSRAPPPEAPVDGGKPPLAPADPAAAARHAASGGEGNDRPGRRHRRPGRDLRTSWRSWASRSRTRPTGRTCVRRSTGR